MAKAQVISITGKKDENLTLPKNFSLEDVNLDVLAQAIHVYRDRSHAGLSYAKTRGEVNRTTKKVYAQKGTGGARHGARSAPIFVGGGTTHGPKGVKRELKLSQAIAQRALDIALTVKAREGEVVVVDGLSLVKKTSETSKFVDFVKKEMKDSKGFLFAISDANLGSSRFIRNITSCEVVPFRSLNAYKVFLGGVLVLDNDLFAVSKKVNKRGTKSAKKIICI